MSEFGFDDDTSGFHGGQHFGGGYIRKEEGVVQEEENIDWTGGSRADWDRTGGGKAFERRDLYDQSAEGKMMDQVRIDLGTYNFHISKATRIEEAIKRHDMALKNSNPPLIVAATLFLDMYEHAGGLTQKNFKAFEKQRRQKIGKLDLIRYVRFLDTLGMEVHLEM